MRTFLNIQNDFTPEEEAAARAELEAEDGVTLKQQQAQSSRGGGRRSNRGSGRRRWCKQHAIATVDEASNVNQTFK